MAAAAGAREAARSAAGTGAVAVGRETAIARAAIAVVGLHYADVAFLQLEPGVSERDHLVSGLIPIGLLAALAAFYPRMRAGLRATLAIFVGLFVLASGIATSVSHAISEGASGTDYTGILAAGAGATLVAVGAATLWRSRKLDRKAWRYSRRALIAIAGLVIAVQLVGGAALGYYATHRPESSVSEPLAEARALATARARASARGLSAATACRCDRRRR